jgi:hypothetical protein
MTIAPMANPVAAKVRVVLNIASGKRIKKHDRSVIPYMNAMKGERTVVSQVIPTRNMAEIKIVATNRMAPIIKTPVLLNAPIQGPPANLSAKA